jgi:hypothetical protein
MGHRDLLVTHTLLQCSPEGSPHVAREASADRLSSSRHLVHLDVLVTAAPSVSGATRTCFPRASAGDRYFALTPYESPTIRSSQPNSNFTHAPVRPSEVKSNSPKLPSA